MTDQTNDTERKIREEDEKLRQRQQDRPESEKGTIGGQMGDNEMGAQGAGFAQGETGAQGEASTADRSPGFVGAQGEESGDYLQDRDPQQAGFAEQGRGAPEEGRDIERGGERTANLDSDIEGSSEKR